MDRFAPDDLAVLQRLCAIPDRKTGGPGNAEARDLICAHVESLSGHSPALEAFSLPAYVESSARVVFDGGSCAANLLDYTGRGRSPAEGPLSDLRRGRRSDFERTPVEGRIVVFDTSDLRPRSRQIAWASAAGARAVVLASRAASAAEFGTGASPDRPADIPAVSVSGVDAGLLRSRSGTPARVEFAFTSRTVAGNNIVLDLAADADAPTVVIGAHYDCWSHGAQDNATSVAVAFLLLRWLRARRRTHAYRFVFFDAEELGLLGSAHHLAANDTSRYACYLNLEMVVPAGGGRLRAVAYSGDMRRRYFSACHAARMGYLPLPLWPAYRVLGMRFPSDVHHFYARGVPCLTTFCASPVRHTELDTLDRVELRRLEGVVRLLIHTLCRIERTR